MNRIRLTLVVIILSITVTRNLCAEITKEKLCRTPDFISAKISPNGKLIAKVGADELGIANVTIMPVAGDSPPKQLTCFKTPEIIQFFWSGDNKKILLLKDENGTGQLNLHSEHAEQLFGLITMGWFSNHSRTPKVQASTHFLQRVQR